MGKALYTFKQVKAYALIGFHNWNNSANRENRDLENFEMFLDPLEELHEKEKVVSFSKKLLKNEKIAKEGKGK